MTVERKFDAKSMLGMLRRYEATVGDLFAVVPPLMSRESVKTADIDGVTLRRISVKDLTEGILMLEEKVEGVELIRVDAAKADRYRLRAGDILMPRMLPRHKYADYMVVNAEYAERDLASSQQHDNHTPAGRGHGRRGAHSVFRDDGDMALIGPRPERPAFCAEFEKRIHGWKYRALVKPGLSGLAQVRGGYDLLPKEKVALDLWRAGYPSLRIARVTDRPHPSIISTALRLCSSVQLGIRELLTGPIRSNYLSAPPFVSNATTRCPTMAQPSQPAGLLSSAQ